MMMMARGAVVIDENLTQLAPGMKALNIHVITPKPGESDEDIADRLLVNRIFITRNTKDFLKYAPGLSIGIIGLEGIKFIDTNPTTKNKTIQIISDAIIQLQLWSKKNGFYLELKEDGKHNYQDF